MLLLVFTSILLLTVCFRVDWKSLNSFLHDFVRSSHISVCNTTLIILQRNQKYYLPFNLGKRGLVEITKKQHFQELSEAVDLSQRAVYSDVRNLFFQITRTSC